MACRLLVMYVMPRDGGTVRIGISASKKVGNSIIRHRCTRLLRECFRKYLPKTKEGYDIVVIVRVAAAKEGYVQIDKSYAYLLRKLQMVKKPENEETLFIGN